MDQEVLQLTTEALWLVLILSAPPIAAATVFGLLVAFLQAATQLQEQTFGYAVKFVVVVVTLMITASMIGATLYNFAVDLFQRFPTMTG